MIPAVCSGWIPEPHLAPRLLVPGLVVPVAAALIAGVALSGPWPRAGPLAELLIVATGMVAVIGWAGRLRALAAAALIAAALPTGWWLGARAHMRAVERPLRQALRERLASGREGDAVFVQGRLREDATPVDEGAVLSLDVERVRLQGGDWDSMRGGVRLSVPTASAQAAALWRRGRCIRAPALLREPGAFRNPGVTDADLQLARRGIVLVGQVKSASLVEPCGCAGAWTEWAGAVRDDVRRAVARHVGVHDAQSAAIVDAILIGDRAAIDVDIEDRLRKAGTFHVIAISGGNIAVLTGVLLWTLSGLRAPPRWAAILTMAALGLYGLVVIRGASVDRALVVALAYLGAGLHDVRGHPLALLASVAAGLVLAQPLVVFDAGFALTFGATAGLIALSGPLFSAWQGLAGGWSLTPRVSKTAALAVSSVIATVAAEAAVLPIGAAAFGRVSLAGVVLNLVAIPMMALAQTTGLATALLAWWCEPGAAAAGWGAHLAVTVLVESARLADAMPWLVRTVPPPSAWLVGGYVAALAGLAWPAVPTLARRSCAVAALCCACAIAGGAWPAMSEPMARRLPSQWTSRAALRVTFLDVAQGDAVVVQFPGGRAMLVDAGGLSGAPRFDIARRVISPALHALGVRQLDWLVLTHGDPDHVGGADAVLRDWRPGEVLEGIAVPRLATLGGVAASASAARIPWRRARAFDELEVAGVLVKVWHPGPEDWERQRVRNDDSVVLELRVGDVSVVLPGDIGTAVEQRLAGTWRPGRFCLLKAAHHGSAGSSSREWLSALKPAAVVYSCGRGNWFGHPSTAALRRAGETGAATFRTDEDGAIQVIVTGERVSIATMAGRWWSRRVE